MIISIGKPKVKSNFFIPLINIFFLFMRLIDRFDCLLHVAPPFPLTFPRLVFRKMRPLPSICTLQIRHLCTKLSTRFYGKAYLLYICFINYIYIYVCVYVYQRNGQTCRTFCILLYTGNRFNTNAPSVSCCFYIPFFLFNFACRI